LHIGSTVPVFTQSICFKKFMVFFARFSRPEGRLNPATFRIPQVETRPADAVNLKSHNAGVRRAAKVQKVQFFGTRLSTTKHAKTSARGCQQFRLCKTWLDDVDTSARSVIIGHRNCPCDPKGLIP
jgi:hypothetical protein